MIIARTEVSISTYWHIGSIYSVIIPKHNILVTVILEFVVVSYNSIISIISQKTVLATEDIVISPIIYGIPASISNIIILTCGSIIWYYTQPLVSGVYVIRVNNASACVILLWW